MLALLTLGLTCYLAQSGSAANATAASTANSSTSTASSADKVRFGRTYRGRAPPMAGLGVLRRRAHRGDGGGSAVSTFTIENLRRVVMIGAHPDDIEIGAGGLLLTLPERTSVHYLVLTGEPARREEARAAAHTFGAHTDLTFQAEGLPDGRLPEHVAAVKDVLGALAAQSTPGLVLTPSDDDRHQDHRLLGVMAPTVFRGATHLQYEIPKWDGDLRRRNLYLPMADEVARRKVDLLNAAYPSQHGRDWWDDEMFLGLARLRGVECRSRYAEAFTCDKIVLAAPPS